MNMFAGNLQPPNPVNPLQTGGANNASNLINPMSSFVNLGQNTLPYAQMTFNNLYGNPYGGQALQGATDAAGMGGAAANNQFGIGMNLAGQGGNLYGAGNQLFGQGQGLFGAGQSLYAPGQGVMGAGLNLLPYASPIMNQAFDPQNALYASTAQQTQDQVRAGEAARGIATTPYGAGLENQAMSNFNIDWQNNLLNRMATGAGAAGGLTQAGASAAGTGANIFGQGAGIVGQGGNMFGQAGGLYGQGGNMQGAGAGLMTGAPQGLYSSAMLPYGTWSGIGQGQNQAIQGLLGFGGSAQGLYQTPTQDWLSMLGLGNQQQSTMNQGFANQLNQSQLGWNQLGQLGQGFGNFASKLGPLMMMGA